MKANADDQAAQVTKAMISAVQLPAAHVSGFAEVAAALPRHAFLAQRQL